METREQFHCHSQQFRTSAKILAFPSPSFLFPSQFYLVSFSIYHNWLHTMLVTHIFSILEVFPVGFYFLGAKVEIALARVENLDLSFLSST